MISFKGYHNGREGGGRFVRIALFVIISLTSHFSSLSCFAQFNTDRLVMIGRSALYYEDYVLSIQYFNQAISAKPYLFDPWYFRAVAKYYLDDFEGAEGDCGEAIQRNPSDEVPYYSARECVTWRSKTTPTTRKTAQVKGKSKKKGKVVKVSKSRHRAKAKGRKGRRR